MEQALSTKPHSETLQRLRDLFSASSPAEAITASLAALSMLYQQRVDLPEMAYAMYVESLEMLPPLDLAFAFTRVQMEPWPYFPTPGELRQLAGVETSAQRSEREAREALSWCLWWIRRYSVEGRAKRGALLRAPGRDEKGEWHAAEYEWEPASPIPVLYKQALAAFGADDAETGMRLVAKHPLLTKDQDEYPTLGLKLSAIEKLEERWIEAWRRANV